MDPITAFIVNLLISLALSAASSMLSSMLAGPSKQVGAGIRATITKGGDVPLSFIMGRYGTAGHHEYVGTWGNDGETPNAYLTHLISVSDLPTKNFLGALFVNGAPVTIDPTEAANGFPILEYRDADGIDHLWVKYFSGSQTTADSWMLDKFGAHPERPWLSDMVGRGIAYARLTALVDRELFNGIPEYFFEIYGLDLDDPRAGDDAEVNPVLMIHTILKGISYGGAWVYGLQGLPATRLPSAVWHAQMDKCDELFPKATGGTEPRFRAGAEISVDQPPIEVINTLLQSCNARMAEIGGVYKILVGAPETPVTSFADEDIVITETQSFDPFPGLESTYNGVNATYVSAVERWAVKDARSIRDPNLEELDDDRRLPADASFPYVFSQTQVQRLMWSLLRENRRFRAHAMTMPPAWWEWEVLDAVRWTSDRNGYDDKVFLITTMDDLPSGNQFIGLKEQDPTDYDWDEADEQEYEEIPPTTSLPPPQLALGFGASAVTIFDAANNARRPGIKATCQGGLADVRAVRFQIREEWGDKTIVKTQDFPYDPAIAFPEFVMADNTILGATAYELRGRYIPFSGRVTRWSNQEADGTNHPEWWIDVITDDVRLGARDIDAGVIGYREMADYVSQTYADLNASVRALHDGVARLRALSSEQGLAAFDQFEQVKREITLAQGEVTASYRSAVTLATGPDSALVQSLEELEAQFGTQLATATSMLTVMIQDGLSVVSQDVVTLQASTAAALSGATSILQAQITGLGELQTVLSSSVVDLNVALGGDSAGALMVLEASGSPGAGFAARFAVRLRTTVGGVLRGPSFWMDAASDPAVPGRFVVDAEQIILVNSAGAGTKKPFVLQGGVAYMAGAMIQDATIVNAQIDFLTIGPDRVAYNGMTSQVTGEPADDVVLTTGSVPGGGANAVSTNGQFIDEIDMMIPAGLGSFEVEILIQAFFDRPPLDAANYGYWNMILMRGFGAGNTQYDLSPPSWYDDDVCYALTWSWTDTITTSGYRYYQVRGKKVAGDGAVMNVPLLSPRMRLKLNKR